MDGVIGLIAGGIAIIGAALTSARWFWRRRDDLRKRVRQTTCRHEWRDANFAVMGIQVLSPHRQRCIKCNARR